MPDILLINPNSSAASTAMMVTIANATLSGMTQAIGLQGRTAQQGPEMIVNDTELAAAAAQVQVTWQDAGPDWAGIIVSAFGDPGMEDLRANAALPVAGICEASLLEAAQGGRRFGIATVTPELAGLIQGRVDALGLGEQYTGIRLTPGAPRSLAADPPALARELALAVSRCIEDDGAQAVIIGGGPLAQAATQLQMHWQVPIIEPIPAAVRQLVAMMQDRWLLPGLRNTPVALSAN